MNACQHVQGVRIEFPVEIGRCWGAYKDLDCILVEDRDWTCFVQEKQETIQRVPILLIVWKPTLPSSCPSIACFLSFINVCIRECVWVLDRPPLVKLNVDISLGDDPGWPGFWPGSTSIGVRLSHAHSVALMISFFTSVLWKWNSAYIVEIWVELSSAPLRKHGKWEPEKTCTATNVGDREIFQLGK